MTEHLLYLGTAILLAVSILATNLLFNESDPIAYSASSEQSFQAYSKQAKATKPVY